MASRATILALAGWLIATLLTGAIGAIASIDAAEFYATLLRPAWAPPASVFGPVWTTLYVLMGIAAWRVWQHRTSTGSTALKLFVVQLFANALWSWLFFAWHQGALAFADVIILWGLIVATLVSFWRISVLAGALLLPYLLWVSFAAALNFAVWRLNPGVL